MNEFEKLSKKDVSAVSKRRNFLKKTATGAVIVSLPAKSVWGTCTVSGTMSGNLSQHGDSDHHCEIPNFNGGRSPGNWKTWDNNLHSTFRSLGDDRQAMGHRTQAYSNRKACYESAISAALNHTMTLDSELGAPQITVQQGLDKYLGPNFENNIFFHMAAVYLNSYFGFYNGIPDGRDSALEQIEKLYLYYKVMSNSPTGFSITEDELGYHDGSTYWSVTHCS
ncbi:hypothetical protein [Aliiglaciecola litoralis]|uniref:Twin-arginine translocation signal domain-containing protein n=1 Tax=Aliiglaciecola litoralis TaxID=582857 RepID=A0ABN1LMM7_9ALTE